MLTPKPQDPRPEFAPGADPLDGASPSPRLTLEAGVLSRRASYPGLSVIERLEAFEDLIDAEVGDTTLWRARNLERELGIRQLYLKFEGGNPTGSQKDRIAFAQSCDALRRGFDTVTLATCGNYGAAVALAAQCAGLKCLIYIPADYHTRRLAEMLRYGAEIIRSEGDYERAVDLSRERARSEGLYDANPGGSNTAVQIRAYGQIAEEIYDELHDAPAAIAVPVSNGTTLAGIHRGFERLDRRGKISHVPRFVAGSSSRKNPIVRSFARGLMHCEDLDAKRIHETAVNEPLVNWHSFDGDQALAAIRCSGGAALDVSDRDMLRFAKMVRSAEGLHVLPASCSSIAALCQLHRQESLPDNRYVAVLTGRRE